MTELLKWQQSFPISGFHKRCTRTYGVTHSKVLLLSLGNVTNYHEAGTRRKSYC